MFRGKGFRDLQVRLEVTHHVFALALYGDTFLGLEANAYIDVGDV